MTNVIDSGKADFGFEYRLLDRLKADCEYYLGYIIKDWEIIGREFKQGYEQQEYDLHEFLHTLNKAMPPLEQLDPQVIDDYCGFPRKEAAAE